MSDDEFDIEDVEIAGWDQAGVTDSVFLRGPPGTGKTTQCLARLMLLMKEHDIALSDVAWVTYRLALATDTIGDLVDAGLVSSDETDNPAKGATRYVGTYHAVAWRRLLDSLSRTQLADYGVNPNDPDDRLEVADHRDKIAFCKHRDIQFFVENPWEQSPGKLLFRVFEWMQNNRLDPSDPDDLKECEYVDQLREEHEFRGSITDLWADWQAFKRERGKIGFAEMLSACIDHDIGLPNQKVLIVDEFHDCTPLMVRLAEQWAEDVDIVVCAGDQDQIVNGYDGPSRELFRDIRQTLDIPEVLLDHSYRVPDEHWAAATRMLEQAHDPPEVSRDGSGTIVQHPSPAFRPSDESDVWGEVPRPEREHGPVDLYRRTTGDIMFLARMRLQVAGINYALDRAGIIYESQQDMGGWFDDDTRLPLFNSLQKLRKADISSVTVGQTATIDQYTGSVGERPLDSIRLSPEQADRLLHHTPSTLLALTRDETDDLREQILEDETTVRLDQLREWVEPEFWGEMTGGKSAVSTLNKRDTDEQDRRALKNALKRYDDTVSRDDVRATVQTIHASKGGEARHVVLYDGISERIERQMHADKDTYKNEHRTWYVGMTRASECLHIMRGGFPSVCKSIIPNDILSTVRRRTDDESDADTDSDADDRGTAAGDD